MIHPKTLAPPPPTHTHIFFPKPLHLLPSSCPQDLRASPVALQHRARGRDASRSEVQMSGPPLPFSSPLPLARPAALPTIISPINSISPPHLPRTHTHTLVPSRISLLSTFPGSVSLKSLSQHTRAAPVPLVHAPALMLARDNSTAFPLADSSRLGLESFCRVFPDR